MHQFQDLCEAKNNNWNLVFAARNYWLSEAERSRNCPKVNVSVWRGTPPNLRLSSGHFCGKQVPPSVVVKGRATISYNYLTYLENYGFRVEYSRDGN